MTVPETFPLIAASSIALVAATTDLRDFKVYNRLTFPAMAVGLLASFPLGGLAGLAQASLGLVTGFAVLAGFFALGGVGAGDVKLFAALGAWLGPWPTLQVFAASALAAGAYAVILILIQEGVLGTCVRLSILGQQMMSPGTWSRAGTTLHAESLRPDRRRRLIPFAATTFVGLLALEIYWSMPAGGPR